MSVTRRRVLLLGLGLTATALASGGALLGLRGSAPRVAGLRILGDAEYRTLAAVARAHLPPGGAITPGADELDLARAFDGYLADEPPDAQREAKQALALFEFGPLLFDRRLATFSNLSRAEQLEEWESWLSSDSLIRRQIAGSLKRFLSLVYYDHRAVWPAIGYPGPSFSTRSHR